jgi:hydroxymethylpyrimidine/phosphomethylpyrimidine kinase
MVYKRVMSVAGSDSGAGAGIQADIKTIGALGGYASTVITAVTSQNTTGVQAIFPVPQKTIAAQIDAVVTDIGCDAVKIGMLYSRGAVEAVSSAIDKYSLNNIVYDPVMAAQGGKRLARIDLLQAVTEKLLPGIHLFTPNLPEASEFLGERIDSVAKMETAAKALSLRFGFATLLKGGHLPGDLCIDCLYNNASEKVTLFTEKKIVTHNNHGTGCTLSSAVAYYLAVGKGLEQSVESAKHYITSALKSGEKYKIGKGNGPLHHFYRYWG